MSLKAILESHPIKKLNEIIKEIKTEVIGSKLSLSVNKKRHSKATLIEHILALDKMGLLKNRPTMNEKPVRAKKEKAPKNIKEVNELVSKATTKKELLEIKKKFGTKATPKAEPKVEDKPKKKRKLKVRNPGNPIILTKKEKTKKQIEAQIVADSLDKPSTKTLLQQLEEEPDYKNPTNVPKKKTAPKKK
jgi:hypothetical protein